MKLVIIAVFASMLAVGSAVAQTWLEEMQQRVSELEGQSALADAAALLEEGLARAHLEIDPSDPVLAVLETRLGRIFWRERRAIEAEAAFERALATWRLRPTRLVPGWATTLNDLGLMLYAEERLVEASERLRRALAIWLRTVGLEHPHTQATLDILRATYQQQGKDVEASIAADIASLIAADDYLLEERESRALRIALAKSNSELWAARNRTEALNQQILQLNDHLNIIEDIIGDSERQINEQQKLIQSLGERLNFALQEEVYSRDWATLLARVKEIIGNQDIQSTDDRLIIKADLLFNPSYARIKEESLELLRVLATAVREFPGVISRQGSFIIWIDGHTDRVPVDPSSPFASNWDLSAQRAISVVDFLIMQGIPPERLAATGFGEYQPLDPRDDEVAYRRNRRIELRLARR